MNKIASYPFVLSMSMLLGPVLMIGESFFQSALFRWATPFVGAIMVVFAFFYVSKRLHEQMEEVAKLKEQLNGKSE
jgi:hypothetical protein